jgi:HEAT repeat protein
MEDPGLTAAEQRVRDLLKQLDLSKIRDKKYLAEAFRETGVPTNEVIPALIAALKDPEPRVTMAAVYVLGELGLRAAPYLIRSLKDADTTVRWRAASALGKIGTKVKEVIPALITALMDLEPEVRSRAADALAEIGAEAAPALAVFLKEADAIERMVALHALEKIGPLATGPELTRVLKESELNVRLRVAASASQTLSWLSRDDLARVLGDSMRSEMGQMGTESKKPVLAMIDTLKDKDPEVRVLAAMILGQLGPEGKMAVPALSEMLGDSNEDVRKAVGTALKKIRTEQSIDEHRKSLEDLAR